MTAPSLPGPVLAKYVIGRSTLVLCHNSSPGALALAIVNADGAVQGVFGCPRKLFGEVLDVLDDALFALEGPL